MDGDSHGVLVLFMSPWLAAGMLDVNSWTQPVHGQFVDIAIARSQSPGQLVGK